MSHRTLRLLGKALPSPSAIVAVISFPLLHLLNLSLLQFFKPFHFSLFHSPLLIHGYIQGETLVHIRRQRHHFLIIFSFLLLLFFLFLFLIFLVLLLLLLLLRCILIEFLIKLIVFIESIILKSFLQLLLLLVYLLLHHFVVLLQWIIFIIVFFIFVIVLSQRWLCRFELFSSKRHIEFRGQQVNFRMGCLFLRIDWSHICLNCFNILGAKILLFARRVLLIDLLILYLIHLFKLFQHPCFILPKVFREILRLKLLLFSVNYYALSVNIHVRS